MHQRQVTDELVHSQSHGIDDAFGSARVLEYQTQLEDLLVHCIDVTGNRFRIQTSKRT